MKVAFRYSYCVLLLPSISKRFLHKLTYVLRVKFVEKPNININFSQSIHNNSGVTAAWFFENTWYWLLPFMKIYLRIRSIWLFREISKHFVHELVITLEFCQNSWRAVNFSLLWLVEKYDWYSLSLSSWLLFLQPPTTLSWKSEFVVGPGLKFIRICI